VNAKDFAAYLQAEDKYNGLVAYLRAARAVRSESIKRKCLLLYYASQVDPQAAQAPTMVPGGAMHYERALVNI
jgi:hypothetical protein